MMGGQGWSLPGLVRVAPSRDVQGMMVDDGQPIGGSSW